MAAAQNKTELLNALQSERRQWEELLASIPAERMTDPGVAGEWSVKNIIIHVATYERYISDRLQEALEGATYTPSETEAELSDFRERFGYPDFGSALLDDDGPNAWVFNKHRSRPLADILDEARRVFQDLLALVQASPETLLSAAWCERIAGNTYEHYHEHSVTIRAWYQQHSR